MLVAKIVMHHLSCQCFSCSSMSRERLHSDFLSIWMIDDGNKLSAKNQIQQNYSMDCTKILLLYRDQQLIHYKLLYSISGTIIIRLVKINSTKYKSRKEELSIV